MLIRSSVRCTLSPFVCMITHIYICIIPYRFALVIQKQANRQPQNAENEHTHYQNHQNTLHLYHFNAYMINSISFRNEKNTNLYTSGRYKKELNKIASLYIVRDILVYIWFGSRSETLYVRFVSTSI